MNYKGKGDKGKGDRQKCWNCGNFGHFSKDCKMMVNAVDYVTDDTQEEWTEEEWNDWLCSVTEGWYENTMRTGQIGRIGLTGVTTGLDTGMNRIGQILRLSDTQLDPTTRT